LAAGLWETLWTHKDMLFNPRYRRLGLVAVPYFWIFEALAPVVEITGYLLVVVGMFAGFLSPRFALLFVLLAVMYGMLSSQLAAGIETFLSTRYPRLRDRAILFLAAFLEFVGYRQFLALERTVATVQVPFKKGQWGKMHRTGIKDSSQTPPAEERTPAGV
jgi:hypothetical protein